MLARGPTRGVLLTSKPIESKGFWQGTQTMNARTTFPDEGTEHEQCDPDGVLPQTDIVVPSEANKNPLPRLRSFDAIRDRLERELPDWLTLEERNPRKFSIVCQSALNWDPGSASNRDPFRVGHR